MTDFLIDPTSGGFLSEELPVPQDKPSAISDKKKGQDEQYFDSREVILEQELAPAGSPDILGVLLEEEAELGEVEGTFEKQEEANKLLRSVEDITSVDHALFKDDAASATLLRIEHRSAMTQNKLMALAEEFNGGFVDDVLELIDQMGYDTWADIRDIPQELSGEGTEVTALSEEWLVALRALDDVEFDQFVQNRIETITKWGGSGSESSWRVMRELQALEAAGVILWDEEWGVLFGGLAAVDVATLGIAGTVTGWRASRSLIGRLRSSTGINVATEAAESSEIIIRARDGEVIDPPLGIEDISNPVQTRVEDDVEDAEFWDDISPTYTQTNIHTPRREQRPPPVSVGRVGQAASQNIFIRQFLDRQSRFSFGTVDVLGNARTWAAAEASRLARASGTSMVDYDVIEEGIQRAVAKFTFGKADGSTFKRFDTAVEHANALPNAKVIDARTGAPVTVDTGSGQFVVETELNVPLRKGVDPLRMEELRTRTVLGKIFGRADIGSSSFLSNLADSADFGKAAFLEDFKKELGASFKHLKKEAKTVDAILTTLRDTPTGGNARSWLTSAEFGDAYYAMKGKYPTRELVRSYETLVQMSDFSWYVMANERLRTLANQGASVASINGRDVFVFPSRRTVEGLKTKSGPVWVWDVTTGQRKSVKTLPDNTTILELGTPLADGSTYVTSVAGNTRRPTLEDAFPYNAGGPRSNPDITWFVGNQDTSWATLIGAKSEKDATKAVEQFNTIANEFRRVAGDDVSGNIANAERVRLDDLIKANNSWNPDIEDLEDFLAFTRSRGVPPNKEVAARGRGERLGEFMTVNDKSMVDLNLENYISYHRHDQALVEFGGVKASNPDPILAIHRQFNSMVSRGAQTQYRMNHPTAWVKAVERAIAEKKISLPDGIPLHAMTDEMKVKKIKLQGSSVTARKLRQEQAVILRRLDMLRGSQTENPFYRGVSIASERMVEIVHDLSPGMGKAARYVKPDVDNVSNTLLSFGFFQRMASFDQVWLQSMHIIPLLAISPKNAAKAGQMAAFIRQAARTGDQSLWSALVKRLQTTTGLNDVQMKALMDHILDSGRGYMKGAIAEDPKAGMSNTVLGKAKDVVSAPYYAGENFSATASRITAYLDTIDEFPTLDVSSRQFWNAVQHRDRDLSFGLNQAQKSLVQSDPVSRVITQWTSYPLRTIESIFFNDNLTGVERGRLAAMTTILWGMGGIGLYNVGQAIIPEDTPSWIRESVLFGADAAIDGLAGVKVGDRIALNPLELLERAGGTVSDPFENIPAFTLVGDTAPHALAALRDGLSGRWGLLGHDVQTLARAWKVVDSGVMAWTMATEEVRRTKSGQAIHIDFTPTQVALQGIGIKPSEATEIQLSTQLVFNQRKRQEKAIKQGLVPFKIALEAAEEGKYAKALQYLKDADAIVAAYSLSETYQAEAREQIFNKAGYDRINWLLVELIKAGYEQEALELKENFE